MLTKGDTGTIKDRMWAVVHARTGRVYPADVTPDTGEYFSHPAIYSKRDKAMARTRELVSAGMPAKAVRLNDMTFTVL